ncbi:twin-arginine translocase TatA/TatE family subunit [Pacificimonas sp. WHA3]|uniref:Sec-independent protein translocase protein TatA n=1 Tax=Pacificimonas pallii TaxID=2827236 RepID=A0ABS6SHS5_9SPHN|nr:twin-arginine translocase TatA/TatE family subunit [Pacificimonas pallii]MBV7257471.1 twin-arginine translocase TatA/TatE family subunit [Pacificimonas pallii]
MGSLSIWHWLIVALIIMLLFGKGRISDMMGDLAKGITSFKKGLAEDDTKVSTPPRQVEAHPAPPAAETVSDPSSDKSA